MEKKATGIYKLDGSPADIEVAHEKDLLALGWAVVRMDDKPLKNGSVSVDGGVRVSPHRGHFLFEFLDSVKRLGKLLRKFFGVVHGKIFRHNDKSDPR